MHSIRRLLLAYNGNMEDKANIPRCSQSFRSRHCAEAVPASASVGGEPCATQSLSGTVEDGTERTIKVSFAGKADPVAMHLRDDNEKILVTLRNVSNLYLVDGIKRSLQSWRG